MLRFVTTAKMPNPVIGYQIQTKFAKKFDQGMIPTTTIKKGTVFDRTIPFHVAVQLSHQMKFDLPFPLANLMTCHPQGHMSDGNRLNGVNPDGSPGKHASYQSVVVKEFGAAPGMVAELRHYGKEKIEKAPIIAPGQYTASSLVGKKNPSFAFLNQVIVRAVARDDIMVVNFNFHDEDAIKFMKSFSMEIQPELSALACPSFDKALFIADNYSIPRPIGNFILGQDEVDGLVVTSARDELIEEGPWKKFEQNVVLKAEPFKPNPFLSLSSVIFFEVRDGKAHFVSRKPDEASALLQEPKTDEDSGGDKT